MAQPIELSRDQTVKLALEQNETYRAALLEKERLRGQYLEARSGVFPRLTFESSYLRNIDLQTSVFTSTNKEGVEESMEIRFGTPHNYNLTLNLYQPLYSAGKVGSALKIAKYGSIYTDARITSTRLDIAAQADKAYLDAVAAREAMLVFQEAEMLADSNLAVVKKLYAQGQVSEYDLLRAQVRAANTRPERIAAANQANLALDYLRNILALPPEDEIVLTQPIEESIQSDLSLDRFIEEALQNRPELQQSEQMVKINKRLIDIARSGYKPSLGINSQIQWFSFTDEFKKTTINSDSWYRSWNVALVLNWPIFSGFETAGKVRQAKVDYNQSRLASSRMVRQIRLEVREAHGKVDEAQKRVMALGETVAQAQKGVEIAQVRFRNGVGTQLELLDAQVALTTARVNKISALHDLAVSVGSLRRAVGREWAPNL
jgi:outer membrane protein TolC